MVILQNNVDIIDSETCYKNFKNTVNLGMTFDSEDMNIVKKTIKLEKTE